LDTLLFLHEEENGMKTFRTAQLAALLVTGLALATAVHAAPPEPQPPSGGGETVDVEIRIVPFYAVDDAGKPVFDLKQDEVEVRVNGKAIPFDTFDSFPRMGTPSSAAAAKAVDAREAPARPAAVRRHVVLLFDTAFSRVPGFQKAQTLAENLVRDTPESDLLYLLTHDFKSGLKQQVGPVAADERGKEKLLQRIRALKPEIGFLDAHAEGQVELYDRGHNKHGVPGSQNTEITSALRTNSQAQLEGTARSLAESLQILADQFQRIREPKLFLFLSQGIDPTLYWEGSDVGLQFGTWSSSWKNIKSYQFRGLHSLYEKPLRALADSGSMSLFVNLDDKGGKNDYLDSSLQHMALNSGGLYLGGVDAARMTEQVANSTAAYYEAGFYLSGLPQSPSRAKVEVVVKRPGVRTWSAGSLKTRETWRGLGEDAKRLLIVDLVEGDAAAQRSRSRVRLDLRNLPGSVLGRSESGRTLLRYEAGWPQELAGRKVDLYNVVLEPTRQAGAPNVLRFDRKEATRVDSAGSIEVEVPEKAAFVWGIVAVDPDSGHTWYRRFHLQGRPSK